MKAKPKRLQVTVRLDFGPTHTYTALFASTFDAYDDAIDRFPRAERIEVKAHPANVPGTKPTTTTTTTTEGRT